MRIELHKNTAIAEELGLVVTGADPEEAVKTLTKKIRDTGYKGVLELPYMGKTFSPKWDAPKPKEVDEFELAQKVTRKLNKDLPQTGR